MEEPKKIEKVLEPGVVISKEDQVVPGLTLESKKIDCRKDGNAVIMNINLEIKFPDSDIQDAAFDIEKVYAGDNGEDKIYIQFDGDHRIERCKLIDIQVIDPKPGIQNVAIAFTLNFAGAKTRWDKTRWDVQA